MPFSNIGGLKNHFLSRQTIYNTHVGIIYIFIERIELRYMSKIKVQWI